MIVKNILVSGVYLEHSMIIYTNIMVKYPRYIKISSTISFGKIILIDDDVWIYSFFYYGDQRYKPEHFSFCLI